VQGAGGVHLVLRSSPLRVRTGLRCAEGRHRQDGRRHGGGLQRVWDCVGFNLDGLVADSARQDIIAGNPEKFAHILDSAETPELTGHVVWALYHDPDLMDVSGRTLIGAELAVMYGIKDEGNRQPPSYRGLFGVHPHKQYAHVMR
jgi:hypothetical protein